MKAIALGVTIFFCFVMLLGWSKPAHAGSASTICRAVDVATFSDRVHIHCMEKNVTTCSLLPGGCGQASLLGLNYFAVETNSPMAANVAQIGLAAFDSSRKLEIIYDDNPGANPAGCQQNDCRRITGIILRN